MNWLSILRASLYYLFVPFTTLFWSIVACLAPVLHLVNYVLSACLLPVKFLAKFETLYIYLGVAALVGLVTGSVLYALSSVLVSMFSLKPVAEERGRSAASVRAAREQKKLHKLENAWQSSTFKSEDLNARSEPSLEKYAEWLEKTDQGLLGQTILEEDDSDGF
ncbi:uncharacterized protein L3040_008609 [Drepanopeziza brunnea f. sp. 'multigermtubi']|uniref:Uncharacterized protein n=1 Tax=Marssonina brunnea f. sp. multigermtubi (strain MB_m1) TaxID=1072389 RepID=K1XM11_MARBU|nr:uncharacterized protein MBM_08242 [Drepanopeziza brunnea f. sp. 'multigermtubi' MB_m1]EKD13524.1 hypothetical protein MBM_08242 [Drepanopeziza brunnea f. sp. 'multigermtubi' MB_m1]KAJ5033494.1 hypothetical protein L3040_008609 [Drepanopeziza brunnea f. sp. 'multigermtubi']